MSELHILFNQPRINDRSASELIGLCHGLLADGKLVPAEVEYLQHWLERTASVSSNPVILKLLDRITEMLVDGIDEDETQELFDTLKMFVGGTCEPGEITKSTTLPLDRPFPAITISGQNFCFTGTFAFGGRSDCEASIADRGGMSGSLTKKTNYLVIGSYATASWAQTSYGRKIEKAVDMKREGHPIRIVSEEHWVSVL